MPAPYSQFEDDELTLRDRLAIDRTTLANERTLLAYARTALALLAGGVALLHFVDEVWAVTMGGAALPLSGVVIAYGVWRYARVRRRLGRVGADADPAPAGGRPVS